MSQDQHHQHIQCRHETITNQHDQRVIHRYHPSTHPPASEELFTWMNQKLGTERAGEC